MNEPSRQKLKQARQNEMRAASPQYTGMVRTPKPRPRAGMADQAPKDEQWRALTYLRTGRVPTCAQRRRYWHKANHAIAVAYRKAAA
jgi:hypothetical protein